MVDPGHGGTDGGATRGKVREADVALAVSKRVAELLDKDKRFKVTLTRKEDETVPLSRRSGLAKKVNGDLFISIHLNSAIDTRAKGAEFYFQNQLPPEEESLFLANKENEADTETVNEIASPRSHTVQTIIDDMQKTYELIISRTLALELKRRWSIDHGVTSSTVKQGPFHVISNVPMPSLLIELGFLSHQKEGPWLAKEETQQELAQSIYKGIVNLKEKMDKPGTSRHITSHAN